MVVSGRFLVEILTFSKFFGSCIKKDWALFVDSKSPYLRVVAAQKYFVATKIEVFQ